MGAWGGTLLFLLVTVPLALYVMYGKRCRRCRRRNSLEVVIGDRRIFKCKHCGHMEWRPLWWRRGRVELYHEHGLGVLVVAAAMRGDIKARISCSKP